MPAADRENIQTRYQGETSTSFPGETPAAPAVERRTVTEERARGVERPAEEARKFVAGGSFLQALAGAATIILAIIGLAGLYPGWMLTVGTIVLGAGLLLEGAAVAVRLSALLESTAQGALEEVEVGGGMTAQFLGGLAGIVLGVLSLIGVLPVTLCAIAVIVFGAAVLLSCTMTTEMNDLVIFRSGVHETARRVARQMTLGAAGIQALIGVAGIVLGILALVGIASIDLVLVGLLCLGAGVLVSGTAITGRMLSGLAR